METENTFDRQGYIVLEKNDGEHDHVSFIAREEWFKQVPLSHTYNQFGVRVAEDEAGDHLELTTDRAVFVANRYESHRAKEMTHEQGDIISAYDDLPLYRHLVESCQPEEITLYQEEVKAYTLWIGGGYKSIVMEVEHGEPEYKLLEDAGMDEIIKEYLAVDGYQDAGPGLQRARGQKFMFTKSAWPGSWYEAEVEWLDDLEYEEQ